ncbi:pilus assembly PilX N-terminal domain-containing protein [Shewanella avicenniae]|uniref:Pilus assembly PilX N-terminal domain-containing protein n=1 Tax=Shewanella avicenniae TaxID=2814294 RepID=A0ABX7QTC9_9GAMM|nr:pilus assembly PilX N-terminal domain-containing protein [Shewanella avicenniae]QSX34739.1 pilus assembly PilX N-terminal domain-containing protein [Shewanella avicenniae]
MKNKKRQSGVVLFFALILLVIMTFIGVALAMNAGQSLRMAGAGSERIEAKAIADGRMMFVINKNSGAAFANLSSESTASDETPQLTMPTLPSEEDSLTVSPMPSDAVRDVGCQRTSNAMSTNLVSCKRIEIRSRAAYGKNDLGIIEVATGVEQQVLTGN